jgi:hypothetical protein
LINFEQVVASREEAIQRRERSMRTEKPMSDQLIIKFHKKHGYEIWHGDDLIDSNMTLEEAQQQACAIAMSDDDIGIRFIINPYI